MTPEDREQRRRALQAEAAELGLEVVEPSRRERLPVEVRLEGLPADVADTMMLLEQRGIVITRPSEAAETKYGRVKQFFALVTSHPANNPLGELPPRRVLWREGDPVVEWYGRLVAFDEDGPDGIVREPYQDRPANLTPQPMFDERGRLVGQVRDGEVRDGGLWVSGVIARSQVWSITGTPMLSALLEFETVKTDPWARPPVKRVRSPWSLPVVRLCGGDVSGRETIRLVHRENTPAGEV